MSRTYRSCFTCPICTKSVNVSRHLGNVPLRDDTSPEGSRRMDITTITDVIRRLLADEVLAYSDHQPNAETLEGFAALRLS